MEGEGRGVGGGGGVEFQVDGNSQFRPLPPTPLHIRKAKESFPMSRNPDNQSWRLLRARDVEVSSIDFRTDRKNPLVVSFTMTSSMTLVQ